MWRSRWNWTNRTGTKCHSKSGCPCPCPVCWRHKLIGHMPNHWSMGSDPGSFVTISANQNNVVRDAIATSIDANCCWDEATMMKWSLDSIKARWHMETGIHYIVACTRINYTIYRIVYPILLCSLLDSGHLCCTLTFRWMRHAHWILGHPVAPADG